MVEVWDKIWGVMLAGAFADCLDEHRERMDPDVVELIEDGLSIDAVTYRRYDDVRTRQWHRLVSVFETYDALICPTMAIPAPNAQLRDGAVARVRNDGRLVSHDMTIPFNNIAQCPALSVPSGFSRDGLPTAIQIIGHRFDDPMVFRIGAAVEASRVGAWPSH